MIPSEVQIDRLSRIAVQIEELEKFSKNLMNAKIPNQDIEAHVRSKKHEYTMEHELFLILCEMERQLKGGMVA
jgi:hypothetical protein